MNGRIASGPAAAPGMVLPRPARVHCAERRRWKLVAEVDCDSPAEGRQVARAHVPGPPLMVINIGLPRCGSRLQPLPQASARGKRMHRLRFEARLR
jgi:hypothetical protein